MRSLAYLNALRAFEATARTLSFVASGKELNVTPAAVGQQVRALEAWLGEPLFLRVGGPPAKLELTAHGEAALPDLKEGFDRLAAGLDILKRVTTTRSLKVTAPPAFAAKWLMPRLQRFHAFHPELDARLDVSDKLVDFASGEADLGIRFGGGRWPGLQATHLIDEEVFPVCSPALLARSGPLVDPCDLRRHTLIHDTSIRFDTNFPGWRQWLKRAGATGIDHARGLSINASASVTQAAIDGQGIALGRNVVVSDDIEAGRLVRLFEQIRYPVGWSYFIVHPLDTANTPRVAAFKEWLLQETLQSSTVRLRATRP